MSERQQFTREQVDNYLKSWDANPDRELGPQPTIFVHDMLHWMRDFIRRTEFGIEKTGDHLD
jgi:hypothetical protein